jgi:hypothetical protein
MQASILGREKTFSHYTPNSLDIINSLRYFQYTRPLGSCLYFAAGIHVTSMKKLVIRVPEMPCVKYASDNEQCATKSEYNESAVAKSCRSQWPHGVRRGYASARLLGMQV